MSNHDRPDPATDPMLANPAGPFSPLDRHWPDPALRAADVARGRVTHTEQAGRAAVDVWARETAEATRDGRVGPGPMRPALADGLRRATDRTIAEQSAPIVAQRATVVAQVRRTGQDVETATGEVTEAESQQATVQAERPADSPGGQHLTQPWVPLAVLPILVFIEYKLTAPSLRAALATDTTTAALAAIALALVTVLAAELIGQALAGVLANRRRAARVALAGIALTTLTTLAIGVFMLATSREDNEAYSKGLQGESSTTSTGFGTPAAPPTAKASVVGDGGTLAPNLGFVAPMMLAGIFAAVGLSMRVGLAAPRREWEPRAAAAAHGVNVARDRLDESRDEVAAATAALDENDLRLGAIVEQEDGTYDVLIERMRSEYQRACHAVGTRPVDLIIDPRPVDNRPVHHRLIDPDRATSTQPVVVETQVGPVPDADVPVKVDVPVAPVAEPAPQEPLMPLPPVRPLPPVPPAPPVVPPVPPEPQVPPVAPKPPVVGPVPPLPPDPGAPVVVGPPPVTNPPARSPAQGPVPRGSWITGGRPPGWGTPPSTPS